MGMGCINEPLMFYHAHSNRRAHSDNLPYLIEQREDTFTCINFQGGCWQSITGFDIQQDVGLSR